MSSYLTEALRERCQNTCELCGAESAQLAFAVSPRVGDRMEDEVAICRTCEKAMTDPSMAMHWQCLAGSIWNPEPSVQALAYRLLYAQREQDWAREIMESVELDEAVVHWALQAFETAPQHLDSNGQVLQNGDSIVLTQGLNVKGASFMAPKGTIVRKIRLVPENTEQIEGKINEQTIVILTKYVRKS